MLQLGGIARLNCWWALPMENRSTYGLSVVSLENSLTEIQCFLVKMNWTNFFLSRSVLALLHPITMKLSSKTNDF
jgi:hypothetical protein